MAVQKPFHLNQWIQENKHLLVPPVGNKNIYVESGDYIVMIVAGPNARKDYHYNETEELFYQLEGDITVYIQEDGVKKAMPLSAGDMFLLPAKVPHSPSRTEHSIGLVIERKRAGMGYRDGLLWFCENCNHKLHEAYFELHDIENDFLSHFNDFYSSEEKRTCSKCGTVMETHSKFIAKKEDQ
ncbi:3-hydroxyanthranilate 3,4-dioxygenase [Flavobacterium aciduliphilum]|uniref:3-hydroxyanthranilate 3,4-dioxygenase n=1 Tax=Flavobacterium aciduliphilum TaxID=1101402 RepID=A0A328YL17_9FLAO|nr:3-hydroxyanthranilate 3,4-dioxygenase [Flavobacterium aciduliphilum]RAR71307.1 3-hydroxyanthranilate 3,4-dioxygenase [Flavobacterium aciduliphilum]